jgi:hypothetical protein
MSGGNTGSPAVAPEINSESASFEALSGKAS